jgi:hypothetical protein
MTTMPRQPEGKLVWQIRRRIEERGGRSFKIQGMDESFQEVGIPDLLVCFHGIFLGLEVKMPGEKPSPIQRQVLQSIEAAGGVARVVCSVDEVDEILDQAIAQVTLAWIAGFYDGEGSFSIVNTHQGRYQSPRISLYQKDPEPLREIQSILGMGHISKDSHECHRLRIGRRADTIRFIHLVGPYLRLPHRRSKVEALCNHLGIPAPTYVQRR